MGLDSGTSWLHDCCKIPVRRRRKIRENRSWILRNGKVVPYTDEPDYVFLWPPPSKVDPFGVNLDDPVLTRSGISKCGECRLPNSLQLLHDHATPPQRATMAPPCATCAALDIAASDNSIGVTGYLMTNDLNRRDRWAYECGQWRSRKLLRHYATPTQHAAMTPPCTMCAAQDIAAYDPTNL